MTASPPLLAVILLAAVAGVESLVFDVPSGSSKCLTEELRRRALSHASYRVAEATSATASTVSSRVTGPRGEELHLTEEGVEAGEFRFEAPEDGKYTACFWTPRYERGAIISVGPPSRPHRFHRWRVEGIGGFCSTHTWRDDFSP